MDVLKKLWKYYKPYKWKIALYVLMGFFVIGMNMINPYVVKLIYDRVIQKNEHNLLIPLLLVMVGQTFVRHLIHYIRAYMSSSYFISVINKIREDVFKKFMGMSFDYINKEKSGNIMQLINGDTEAANVLFGSTIPAIIEIVMSFVIASIILFSMNSWLALACFIVLGPVYWTARKYTAAVKDEHNNIRETSADLNTRVQENIAGVRVVRSYSREDFEAEKFGVENGRFRQAYISLMKKWSLYHWKLALLGNYPYIVVMLLGGIFAINDRITIGTYLAFGGYIGYVMNPINAISGYVQSIQSSLVAGEKVFAFLERTPSIMNPLNPVKPENSDVFEGNIVFDHVSFVYDGHYILQDISFEAGKGRKIGIMGETGSGKTTIINLLGRYYDCSSGSIFIDGADIKNVDLESLRKSIAVVMQDVFLFSDSVEGNIAYGKLDASMDEITKMSQYARAHDFIMRMPERYDTVVGERGIGLSGGQKQRISIARALIMNSPILVLDDATSSLDMETEHEILEELKELMKEKTQFIIAHRISSIRDADEILFLKDGQILERGTHEELIKLKGAYYDIYVEQYQDNADKALYEVEVS